MPVIPGLSFIEPTLYHTWKLIMGEEWSSFIISLKPFFKRCSLRSSVICSAEDVGIDINKYKLMKKQTMNNRNIIPLSIILLERNTGNTTHFYRDYLRQLKQLYSQSRIKASGI
jgi:hypothetical protein